MDIVIRVLYNNMNWKSACVRPGLDSLCQKCFAETNIDIKRPSKNDEVCNGLCWEQDICINYEWGCTPKGKEFGKRAEEGAKVYFVFQQPNNKYTLWGVTTVKKVNVPPKRNLIEHEIGYDKWLELAPFEPLPTDKWVRDLKDIDLVNEQWKMGRFRFISPEKVAELDGRLEGKSPESQNYGQPAASPTNKEQTLTITFAPNIYDNLLEVSYTEGRQIVDIIKQAVAEWLRARR